MRATVMYRAGDVRIENVPDATIVHPTDAVVRVTRACICGSDLWPYNLGPAPGGQRMGHEAIGIVEAVGSEVRTAKAGDLVVMPFAIRRQLRVLPRRPEHRLRPRLVLRQQRHQRRPGRGASDPLRRWDALPASGR